MTLALESIVCRTALPTRPVAPVRTRCISGLFGFKAAVSLKLEETENEDKTAKK